MLIRSSLSILLSQISDLLDSTRVKVAKMPATELPEGIQERVENLEKVVNEFRLLSERMLASAGFKPSEETGHSSYYPRWLVNASGQANW